MTDPTPPAAVADPITTDPGVTIRMYKGLLGDCFLIRVAEAAKARFILIDCGILQHIPGDAAKMKAVAADIAAVTGGHLDLLVVTHEHYDHLSGFVHAADVFFADTFVIDELWLAWTEDPKDGQANALRARFNNSKLAVTALAQASARLGMTDQVTAGLEAFIGPQEAGLAAAKARFTGAQVLPRLQAKAGPDHVRYLQPGNVVDAPGGLRAYVLGPPRNKERLFQDLPSSGPAQETYLARQDAAVETLRAAADGWIGGDGSASVSPFATRYVILADKAEAGGDDTLDWLKSRYYGPDDWRRIDGDWMGVGSAIALKLDSDTNNTSLVLALEVDPSHKVLLFAADAQVGNWLSWHDQDYTGPAGAVTAKDLLARTVFYKVGHHCSHNATLKDLGLGLMTSPELTAMIPVVEADAHKQGKGWNMPYPPLLAELETRTAGRVLRGDQGLAEVVTPDPGFLTRTREKTYPPAVDYRPIL
jgi:hypothetical protein